MSEAYDSRQETEAHIDRVQELLDQVINKFVTRSEVHDASKLQEPEKSGFDAVTGRLKGCTYGSDEYKGYLAELGPILRHHYENNSHHPEHYPNGIAGMTLLDLIEMLCDWKAAGERHKDGSMEKSLAHNRGRFEIGDQLHRILENTAREMGFLNV